MRIQKIQIENFGKLQKFEMEFTEGLNRIYAENGWGKSTVAAFIKAMFYGLDYTTKRSLKDNERKKYLPWQGGAFGGSMTFTAGDKSYRVERFFGAKDKEDQFVLYDLSTGLESSDYSERLGEELFHLDRTAFEQSSYFAQQDFLPVINDSLNAGLTHVEEQAGDIRNYEKACASLEERMKFYQKTGERGEIPRLLEERRRVQEQLADCRKKEEALQSWKQGIAEKEQQETAQRDRIQQIDAQMQEVRNYKLKKAQKEQLELLRQQAGAKEERLRQIRQELEQYVKEPAKEAELDQCREWIYHLKTLKLQEEDKSAQLEKTTEALKKARQEQEACAQGKSGMLSVLPTAVLVIISGALVVLAGMPWKLAGILPILAAAVLIWQDSKKRKRQKQELEEICQRVRQLEEEQKKAKLDWEKYQKQAKEIRQAIGQVIAFPAGCSAEELEIYWKRERQSSQEYAMLKNARKLQEKEFSRSREDYLAHLGTYSDSQLRELRELQKPEQDGDQLSQDLQAAQKRLEDLQKEKSRMEHQLEGLKQEAERIPELEEEAARLAEKAEDSQREHDLLEKTLKYLKTAKEQFQTRYLKNLQQGLEKYLAELEPVQIVEPALDVKLKVKVREAGASRDLEYFSAGWQDMIQLAERFAIVDALYEEEQPVLILDDPFVNLDAEKQKRAMALLEKMAGSRQMIYFTCHDDQVGFMPS